VLYLTLAIGLSLSLSLSLARSLARPIAPSLRPRRATMMPRGARRGIGSSSAGFSCLYFGSSVETVKSVPLTALLLPPFVVELLWPVAHLTRNREAFPCRCELRKISSCLAREKATAQRCFFSFSGFRGLFPYPSKRNDALLTTPISYFNSTSRCYLPYVMHSQELGATIGVDALSRLTSVLRTRVINSLFISGRYGHIN
jgi:hypothetical protein